MRRLAAIMFTDVVGYSALMSQNENRDMQILADNRELQKDCSPDITVNALKRSVMV